MPFGFESKEEFDAYVANLTNNQVRGVEQKLKQFKKETADEFTKQLDAFGQSLGTKLTGLETAIESKKTKKDKEKEGEGGSDAPAPDPRLRTLERTVEELKAIDVKRAAELEKEKAKTRNIAVKAKLREELEKQGIVDPFRLKAAMAVLIDQEKRVDYSDGLDDAAWKDTDGGFLDLALGIRAWMDTPEGQFYAPPKGAVGAGGRRAAVRAPQGNGAASATTDPGEILAEAIRRGEL